MFGTKEKNHYFVAEKWQCFFKKKSEARATPPPLLRVPSPRQRERL